MDLHVKPKTVKLLKEKIDKPLSWLGKGSYTQLQIYNP